MNIFVTDPDPIVSARELCDRHVRSKMQIESAIMLAHCFSQEVLNEAPRTKTGKVRKSGKGYFKHQCSVWVRESRANFDWLVSHALEMFNERRFRWPDADNHFTENFILWCRENRSQTIVPEGDLTPFAIAIGADSACRKVTEDFDNLVATEQYRRYIKHDKTFATWTTRERPSWYEQI